ncbi:antibiotic biosynthesis monooxygenase [Hyphobacterium sp. CCMP332]|nr:antibiotic biosynthesis monooxygenase [Hyphobacterium sp. CCMP332]
MLIRIVRMSFKPEEVDNFLKFFDSKKEKIRAFPGCRHLELWQDHHFKNVFSTYSHWDGDEDLQNYRNSELFRDVWSKTKLLFLEKAIAYSNEVVVKLD